MNRYAPALPRTVLAVAAAAAMTALVIGVAVVAPATSDSRDFVPALASAPAASAAPATVAIIPARIDVIGVRESRTLVGHGGTTPRQDRLRT